MTFDHVLNVPATVVSTFRLWDLLDRDAIDRCAFQVGFKTNACDRQVRDESWRIAWGATHEQDFAFRHGFD